MSKETENIDVLKHHLVPKMEVMREEGKQQLFEKFGIDLSMLPRMNYNDPAAVAIGAKAGDVVKIRRRDETGEYDYYRLVV
ncbi:MAG TPA: DNA-directed RNA polymerase subunit RpoH/Rpb5 C-terminal domain-containing protein [Candidatus Bilamarchaeaceae archaeon]|nr:DNA-directed RNA polymerase subunit RpoH/Rpb5 C-terminal domain-containing protein [Candidatus Bilamarchaeaceae archaeon]